MSSHNATRNTTTYAIALEARHELPRAVELATAMQGRDLGQHLLEVHLRLLRLLAQELDRPLLALAEERKQRIEQLVARHTRHALVLPFWRLDLRALQEKKQSQRSARKGCDGDRAHREVRETRRGRDAAAEHLPTATPRARAIHEPDAHRLLVLRCRASRREAALVAAGHARAEVALVLHLARHDRRAGAAGARGRFGALRDDDLVVYVLVHHIELVDVVALAVVRRHKHYDARGRAGRDVVYPDLG